MNSAGSSRAYDGKYPFVPPLCTGKYIFLLLSLSFSSFFLRLLLAACSLTPVSAIFSLLEFVLSLKIWQDLDSDSQCRLGSCFRRTPSPTSLSDSRIEGPIFNFVFYIFVFSSITGGYPLDSGLCAY